MNKKFTVFFEQINRTNYQVKAENEKAASNKADKLYKKYFSLPSSTVQEDWIVESDGEDK